MCHLPFLRFSSQPVVRSAAAELYDSYVHNQSNSSNLLQLDLYIKALHDNIQKRLTAEPVQMHRSNNVITRTAEWNLETTSQTT